MNEQLHTFAKKAQRRLPFLRGNVAMYFYDLKDLGVRYDEGRWLNGGMIFAGIHPTRHSLGKAAAGGITIKAGRGNKCGGDEYSEKLPKNVLER